MKISVIIPVYNAERFVRKAVESALQFDEVKEVILVEDASPDNALELCQQLVQEDSRVKLFRHPNGENRGAGASRNLGLEYATQQYIAFLDADDFYLPNRFDKDKEVFEQHNNADGCYNAIGVHYYTEEAHKQFTKTFGKTELTTVREKLAPNELFPKLIGMGKSVGYFSLVGLTLKKNALAKMDAWFNESLRLHQDTDFIFRLAYYLQLYPSNTETAVAKRGVHGENRITALRKDQQKVIANQILLWTSMHTWAKREAIEKHYQDFFAAWLKVWQIKNASWLKGFIKFHIEVLKTPDLWRMHKFYNLLHTHFFGTNKIALLLLKTKHKTQKTLRIKGEFDNDVKQNQ